MSPYSQKQLPKYRAAVLANPALFAAFVARATSMRAAQAATNPMGVAKLQGRGILRAMIADEAAGTLSTQLPSGFTHGWHKFFVDDLIHAQGNWTHVFDRRDKHCTHCGCIH